ncbi:hypothetical protein [Streptomyces sp. NPDC058385]|uniref:hypothetical protein n=1 Tax=Streptomyces sp. NPDC058385 TaxID=3346473 RepID=UPI00365556B7
MAEVTIYGRLTLGIVWGLVQLTLFIASTWRHENESTRLCDPLEQSSTVDQSETRTRPDAATNDFWR